MALNVEGLGTPFDGNEVVNGTYGFLYDQNGTEVQGTQEFEATVKFKKEDIIVAGKFMTTSKVMGGSGTGTMSILKLDSSLAYAINEDPTRKYVLMGKLADPTSRGEESIQLKGVSFDALPLMKYKVGELVNIEVDFTFDDCEFKDSILSGATGANGRG